MSELTLTSPEECPNKNSFSCLLHIFYSFIVSHPLCFSSLLFFSPYIFKILSFLSPLFITTVLLILALVLSTLCITDSDQSLETQESFLFSFCDKFCSALEHKFDGNDEDFKSLEEADKMVVEMCSVLENEICSDELKFVDKFCSHESKMSEVLANQTVQELTLDRESPSKLLDRLCLEERVEIQQLKFDDPMVLEKAETEKCEKVEEEEKVKLKSDDVLDNGEWQDRKLPTKQESNAQKVDLVGDKGPTTCTTLVRDSNDESYILPKFSNFEKKNEEDVTLKSFGSMRKEKEWRRTLACKLFEERHNADVGQGMDQLWETYENQTATKHTEESKKSKMKKMKSIEKKVVEEEEDEDEIDQQQLCCLQALKFSTSKMHMGIARPNLLKLTKAFKGFGRFYNNTKHSKKV